MQNKPLPLGSVVFVVLLSFGVLWLWISFVRFRPDDLQDFSTVTGTLLSAEEHITFGKSRSGHLEIRLQESAVRYCVPKDGYFDHFLFAEVPPGATVQLTALASAVAAPRTSLLNSTPTVFVRGVRVGGRDYCVVQDHITWQRRYNWSRLGLAVAGSALLAVSFFGTHRRRKAQEEHEA